MDYEYEYDTTYQGRSYRVYANATAVWEEEKQTWDYPGSLSVYVEWDETKIVQLCEHGESEALHERHPDYEDILETVADCIIEANQ